MSRSEETKSLHREKSGSEWFGFSVRSILLIIVGIVLFSLYVSVLLFGENSLTVLENVQKEKRDLLAQKSRLRHENQKLQKEYFELLQITGD